MARESIIDQFSYYGDAGAIWEGFDAFLDTDGYLNLGYSSGFESHLIGSPQRRLAGRVRDELDGWGIERGDRLLDIGCGRGGPTQLVHVDLGLDCLGIDLVPYNLQIARAAAMEQPRHAEFVLGDGVHLPVCTDGVTAVISIDAIAYLTDIEAVFDEISRVLHPSGVAVLTDLHRSASSVRESQVLTNFSNAWGFAPLRSRADYRDYLNAAGLTITTAESLTDNSIGRFRTWTTRYRRVRRGLANRPLEMLADRLDLDLEAIDRQVETAHHALPRLEHHLYVIEPD